MGRTNNRYNLGTFTADGESPMKKSNAFRNQGFTLITTGFTGTVKFYASNAPEDGTAPDISASADTNNEFSVVNVIDLQIPATTIAGGTGKSFTTDTSVTRYEMNDNNNNFVGVGVSGLTAGTVEIKLDLTDNQ